VRVQGCLMITQHQKTKKWLLHTRDGSRVLGTHDTYEKALKQERAIQISKRRRKNPLENCDKRSEINAFRDKLKSYGRSPRDNMYKLIGETGIDYHSTKLTSTERKFIEEVVQFSGLECEARMCYHNSQFFLYNALSLLPRYPGIEVTYIEGYITYTYLPLPIAHGWLLINDKVVDLTITQEEYDTNIDELEDRVIGRIPEDMIYLGIPIMSEDVVELIESKSETHTILDDFRSSTRHIRQKYYRTPAK